MHMSMHPMHLYLHLSVGTLCAVHTVCGAHLHTYVVLCGCLGV